MPQQTHELKIDGTGNYVAFYLLVEGNATDMRSGHVDQTARNIPGTPYTAVTGFVAAGYRQWEIDGRVLDIWIGDGPVTIMWDRSDITSNPQQIVENATEGPAVPGGPPTGGNGGSDDGSSKAALGGLLAAAYLFG